MEEQRISREHLYIQIALLISQRATCCRLHVGAVAVQNNRMVLSGYNGPSKDEPHCNPEHCDVDSPCTRSVHAEDNLIRSAKELGINLQGATLFCTHQPCYDCSKKILRAGFETVFFMHPYRREEGLINLLNNDVTVYQIDEQGKYTRRQSVDNGNLL